MVTIHDVLGGFRILLGERDVRSGAAEHGVDADLRADALLLQRTRHQDELVLVVRRNDQVRIGLAHLQRDVGEVALRRRVTERLHHLDAETGQLLVQELRHARSECTVLVHDHGRLGRIARGRVDLLQGVQRERRDLAETRREAERVGQAARHDLVDDADVDEMRKIVLGGGLRGRKRNAGGERALHGEDASLRKAIDFGRADIGLRLRVGEHRLESLHHPWI